MTASPVHIQAPEKFDVPLPAWLKNYLYHPEKLTGVAAGDRQLICEAFRFAHALHEGQTRKSGEPYIAHPIAVAGLLLDLGGDGTMIAAGFLHDVVEDTAVTPEDIEARFGTEVRQLVEGVTKLTQLTFSSKTERQAENFRRMFLSMAKDIRVIVVKLADRLHNMRTLEHLRLDKQERIALETREIFAPLANRLGIWRFKWELEDLCFKYLEREAYRDMQSHISEKRTEREAKLEEAISIIRDRLRNLGLHVWEIKGRPKHLYSIYNKMQSRHKEFNEIFDVAGIRIIVESNDECYRALAVVHDAFKPIPGRFKDYIGLPKPNRYQSLHTTVVGLNGRPLEVQIRTMEMHHIAEYGIAAHWKYKESGNSAATEFTSTDEKFTWLRQLIEWQSDLKDAEEYIDNLKDNLFEDDVYVFTPNGDVVALAKGATSIDFAYRIHTEVGNHMKGARINGRWSVLETKLKNGDIVEIVTQKNAHPSLDWLNYVVTPSAKNRIRQWYKRSHRDDNLARGRLLLEKELGKTGLESILKSEAMQAVAVKCNYQHTEDLLAALGYGEITLNHVVNRWRDQVRDQEKAHLPQLEAEAQLNTAPKTIKPLAKDSHKYPIAGIEGLVYTIASCCAPLPGEPIIGVVTRSHKGISIHHRSCTNVNNFEGDRLIPVHWNDNAEQKQAAVYPVDLSIEVIDRVGVLKDILSRLSDQNINVRKASVKTSHSKPAIISLSIDIRNSQQLTHSINQIKNMSDTLNVRRITQIEAD